LPQKIISGRYELLEELGHGGMGDIWRGFDTVLDRPVAVKLIRQASITSPSQAEEFSKRFQREARITARIQHPGVPQVYDAGLDTSHEQLFLVMELVDGLPLAACIRPGHPLPVGWAAAVAAQVATALSYAHDVPVIHRDLKPGNILLARDGTVKVLDFGIAAILRPDVTKLTATGNPIGSSQYMSPEQVRGGRLTPQADLYALGCVLHELLTGQAVFEADSEYMLMHQHINAAPTAVRELRPDVPEALEELVRDLLLKAPDARPADTHEVHSRLLPFLPRPGEQPTAREAGPEGTPDPTAVFRRPYAPRARAHDRGGEPLSQRADAEPVREPALSEQLRQDIKGAYEHCNALLEEERYAQAADVLGEVIEPAALSVGEEHKQVLALRRRRAAIQALGGDYRAALPEFDDLAAAHARTAGPNSEQARGCRAQAARCRAELGQMTDALAELKRLLAVARSVDSDVSEEALDLRQNIGELLFSQGRAAEAAEILGALYQDVCVVYGSGHEIAEEIVETLALIKRDLDDSADG
jgi:eukaryotic-like serine/threonine-protein kinase